MIAAELGHAQARIEIAQFYYSGVEGVVDQSYEKAVEWFEKVAEMENQAGREKAQVTIAVLFEEGRGVEQDFAKAAKWYTRAAQLGHELAQYQIGNMYELGLGVVQNYTTAKIWYEKAAEQGHENAQIRLGFIMHQQGQQPSHRLVYAWILAVIILALFVGRRGLVTRRCALEKKGRRKGVKQKITRLEEREKRERQRRRLTRREMRDETRDHFRRAS